MAVSGNPAERGTFEMFAAALGRHDLLDDPRFTSVAGRLEHLDEIRRAFLAAARDIPDGEKFEHAAERTRPRRRHGEISASARRVAVGRRTRAIATVSDRGGGDVRIPNPPWRFDDEVEAISGEPKFRGEDNRAVLRELLGYDDAAITKLEDDGVLSSRLPR